MPMLRLQVWHFGCDYPRCGAVETVGGVSRDVAIGEIRSRLTKPPYRGWAVSRIPGGYQVRCPTHRGSHAGGSRTDTTTGVGGRLLAAGIDRAAGDPPESAPSPTPPTGREAEEPGALAPRSED